MVITSNIHITPPPHIYTHNFSPTGTPGFSYRFISKHCFTAQTGEGHRITEDSNSATVDGNGSAGASNDSTGDSNDATVEGNGTTVASNGHTVEGNHQVCKPTKQAETLDNTELFII